MKSKIINLVLLILFFFFIIYLSSPTSNEGMCTMEEEDSELVVYYGSIGSVSVKVLSNGDKLVIKLNPNENVDKSNMDSMVFYGPDGDTIIVYKTENDEYVISSETHLDENDIVTYYGKNGSVTVKTDSEGNKSIVDYNTSYSNDSTSINTFYGPNGNDISVIRTPDGNLKLVTGKNPNDVTTTSKNDYVLKTKIVPPVCPTCPAINYCNNGCGDIDNANELEDDEEDSNDESNSDNTNGSQNDTTNGSSSNGSNDSSENGNGNGNSNGNGNGNGNSNGNGNGNNGYSYMIGSLLNKYEQADPMPVLSDFSKF